MAISVQSRIFNCLYFPFGAVFYPICIMEKSKSTSTGDENNTHSRIHQESGCK